MRKIGEPSAGTSHKRRKVPLPLASVTLTIIACLISSTPAFGLSSLTVSNDGAYNSTLVHLCPSTPFTSLAGAAAACGALGEGWAAASLPTRGALEEAYAAFGGNRTIVGVSSHPTQQWRWTAGRLSAVPFWIGNGSATDEAKEKKGFALPFRYPSYPKPTLFNYTPWAAGYPSGVPVAIRDEWRVRGDGPFALQRPHRLPLLDGGRMRPLRAVAVRRRGRLRSLQHTKCRRGGEHFVL